MTPQEIKDNAPDGATHYHKYERPVLFGVDYFKYINSVRHVYNSDYGGWIEDPVNLEEQSDSEINPL